MRDFFSIIRVLPGVLFLCANPVVAGDMSINVDAHRAKSNETSWDGINGSFMVPGIPWVFTEMPKSPPDLAACLILLSAEWSCDVAGVDANGRLVSWCHDSHRCSFRLDGLPSTPFGVLIIDLDIGRHDFVDGFIVPGPSAQDSGIQRLNQVMRGIESELAPSNGRRRNLQAYEVLRLESCAPHYPCSLSQSDVYFDEASGP